MKKLILTVCMLAIATSAIRAQEITKEERDNALKYLEKTRAGVIAATKGLSEAQWTFKPATNKWSVAEVMEHIAAAEDLIMDNNRDKVMKGPARTKPEDVKALDQMILKMIPDRTEKRQAPEPLVPVNRFKTPKESLKHFEDSRAKTVAFLKEAKDLRGHAGESPMGKELDGYEWVLFVAAHSERHTKQMLEVKADPNFPKK